MKRQQDMRLFPPVVRAATRRRSFSPLGRRTPIGQTYPNSAPQSVSPSERPPVWE